MPGETPIQVVGQHVSQFTFYNVNTGDKVTVIVEGDEFGMLQHIPALIGEALGEMDE